MGPLAQATAATAAAQRAKFTSLSLLKELGETLPASKAAELGVTVLHQEGDNVAVGLFELPKLDSAVLQPPNS